MSLLMISRRSSKRQSGPPGKKISIERMRRQKILSHDLLDRYTPKHYPSIFFDQRLRSRFFK